MNSVLFDHPEFLIVNKPSGVGMHIGSTDHGTANVISVQAWAKKSLGVSPVYLVHRLDTGTSGCLILAKNPSAASVLSQLFAQKSVQKYYLALSDKKPKKSQGKISGDMQKSRSGSYRLSATQANPALTFFFNQACNTQHAHALRLFYLKPITGKTHQLRVALKSLGSPILGDSRYKGRSADRLYLHCQSISFEFNNTQIEASCAPNTSDYFTEELLQSWQNAQNMNWPKSSNYTSPNTIKSKERLKHDG